MTQHQHEQEAAEIAALLEAIAPDYDSLGESTEQLEERIEAGRIAYLQSLAEEQPESSE